MGSKKVVFENKFIRVVSQPAGDREIITFDRTNTQTGAIVVPVMNDGRIVLIREFRHGAGKDVIGVVKGASDSQYESAKDVAVRELREELGMVALDLVETNLEPYALPSLTAIRGKVVFAYGCSIVSQQDLEPDEDISIYKTVTKPELASMLRNGDINDGESCLALQAYLLESMGDL